MKILFLHGWHSTPGGLKPTYLQDRGHTVLNPALPDDDFEESVRIAQDEYDNHHPDVIVGLGEFGSVFFAFANRVDLVPTGVGRRTQETLDVGAVGDDLLGTVFQGAQNKTGEHAVPDLVAGGRFAE